MEAPSSSPPVLTLKRFFHLYLPLALTFLLMSGSSPFINKGIGQLPLEVTHLAVFANVFVICLFLYSPCFIVRDAAQKFIRGRTSYLRTTIFFLTVSTACTALLLLLALTPLMDHLILTRIMRIPDDLLGLVKQAVLAFLPMPTLIVLRGIHQAAHIVNDTPKWIGIGTAGRFLMILGFVFGVGVPYGLPGGVIGGAAIAIGIGTEVVVNFVTARRYATFLRTDPEGEPPPSYRHLWAFSGPLFLANAMGVFLQPLAIAIVNAADAGKASAAAFGVVKSFTWFFSSTLFAMQTMALAKADTVRNLRRLLVFELIPVTAFSLLILFTAYLAPVRTAVLGAFFEIDAGDTFDFIVATLPLTLCLPVFMALRATARGLIMRSGYTMWVTLGSFLGLAALIVVYAAEPTQGIRNGAVAGFLCWIGAMVVELLILAVAIAKIGPATCVSEGRRGRPGQR